MNLDEIIQSDIRTSITRGGLLLFLAGFFIFMGIITCEIFYKAPYNTRDSYISELATESATDKMIQEPSATIFNTVMIISGLMVIASTFFVQKIFKKYYVSILLGLLGVGFTGVGIFPGYVVPWHLIFALVIFISGGLAAIASGKIVHQPLRSIFVFFGVIALAFLLLFKFASKELGGGGAERWLFYPIVFWIMGMGAYLLGIKDGHRNTLQSASK